MRDGRGELQNAMLIDRQSSARGFAFFCFLAGFHTLEGEQNEKHKKFII